MKRIDWILIALIGLILQGFWARQLSQPTYMDSYYYTTNGERLVSGHGFTEIIVWQFLDDPTELPTPSHTYWMPLPSILAAAGNSFRDDFRGSQLFFWLLGGLLPLLAYVISWQLSNQRWQAWVAALFVAVGGFYAAFMSQPSTFAPFAWAGGLGLLAVGLATAYRSQDTFGEGESPGMTITRQRLWWLIAGLMAGLAHLTRADGFLLLLVGLFVWALVTIKRPLSSEGSPKEGQKIADGIAFSFPVLLILGYMLTMGWWLVRNWLALGRLLPTAGAQSVFLTTYDDLFAYDRAIDLEGFLEWGVRNILLSKIQGIWLALQTFVAIPGLIFLVPFIIVALIFFYRQKTTRMLIQPVIIFGIALFISNAFIFTLPGSRGSLFHSSIALWPWSTAFAAAGIGLAVDWAAKKLPHWQPERAKRIFSGLFILVALIMTLFLSQTRLIPDEDPEIYRQVGQLVPPDSVVMAGNAPALNYYSGLAAISVPNEDVDSVLEAGDRFGVNYVMLNQNRPEPLKDLYLGKITHPRLTLIWSSGDVRFYEVDSQDR